MRNHYYGITLSAHLVVFYEKFFSTFLRKLDKPFFIDTVSYVFARDLDNIKKVNRNGELTLKKSYQKLVDYCDGKIKAILEKRQFLPKDFLANNEELIKEFSKKLISFQKHFFSKKSDKAIEKYSKILGKELGSLNPLFLTTPYFYFESINDPWYNISLKLAQTSISLKKEFELYTIICFSKELLVKENDLEKIIDDYSNFDGYIFWISDFDEKNVAPKYLSGLINFIEKLNKMGKPIINLYGEYFSLILSKLGLSGYSRGIGFSEKKFVDACVTGGGQPKRYYFPFLHYSLSEMVVREFFSDYPKLLCECKTCQLLRNQLGIPRSPSITDIMNFFNEFNFTFDSKKHLMEIHTSEIDNVIKSSITDLATQLQNKIIFFRDHNMDLYNIKQNHLRTWLEGLLAYTTQ